MARLIGRNARSRRNPLGVPDAAGEGPAPAEKVPAVRGDRRSERSEYPGSPGRFSSYEDFLYGVVLEEGANATQTGCPDHQAPPCGGLDFADRFQHVQLRDKVGLRSYECVGQFQAEQARLIQGVRGSPR